LPTACQWKPPAPAVVSATALAAKTMSLPASPSPLASSSYQTVHGTVSFGPVNAMSGATLFRVGSMFNVWLPVEDDGSEVALSRLRPTTWKQKLLTGAKPPGQVACTRPREAKIWNLPAASVVAPSTSFHTTHGTGFAPAVVAPPATEGSSAVRVVWTLSEGT